MSGHDESVKGNRRSTSRDVEEWESIGVVMMKSRTEEKKKKREKWAHVEAETLITHAYVSVHVVLLFDES